MLFPEFSISPSGSYLNLRKWIILSLSYPQFLREYLTVYVNITDNQTVGCGLIYIMDKFFVVEVKSGSIAERLGSAQKF